jgi:predicted P-loop ATPase
MAKGTLINLPALTERDADAHARAETARKDKLFAWGDDVLKQLGLTQAVARASSLEALRRIVLDVDSADVILAIRAALHPASSQRQAHFAGLREGALKQVLKNRFTELKKDRETALRRGKQKDWSDKLKLDKDGRIIGNLANLVLILREQDDWKGVLAFDELNVRVTTRKPPPFEEGMPSGAWSDHHDALTRVWFQHRDIKVAMGDVGRAIQTAARFNPFNPVRDYLEALTWDGVPRLDTWMQTYLHVEDSAYARAVGPRYLMSGVARVYKPGCKVDHVLTLEGPQGKLKSETLRTLALRDEWFTDRLSNLSSKDAAQEVGGVWIIEVSEMDAILKSRTSSTKSYLTRRFDRFRPPYAKYPVRVLRQCIFAVSINPPPNGYLTDTTGNRRFWPVLCRGTIDRDGVEQVRDQLWAETVHRFKAGQPWWLETAELEALATAEQEKRFKRDVWEDPIKEWLGDRIDVSLWEVLEHALDFPTPRDCSQSVQRRVVAILTQRLKFKQYRPRTPKGRTPRYRRDPPSKKSSA